MGRGRAATTWCDLGPRSLSLSFPSSSPGRGARGLQPWESNLASSRGFQREAGDRAVIAKSPGPEASAAISDYFQPWAGRSLGGCHHLMPRALFAPGFREAGPGPQVWRAKMPQLKLSGWKTHSRARSSWHSCDGSPFWKLVPAPSSPFPNCPFSLCCRPCFSAAKNLGSLKADNVLGGLQRTEGCLLSKWC